MLADYIVNLPNLRAWDAEKKIVDRQRPESWISNFSLQVYKDAQRGNREHPLQKIIESAIEAPNPVRCDYEIINAPSGCSPDVAAYLSGEPDSMLDFAECRRSAVEPLTIYADTGASFDVRAEDVAKRVSSIAKFCYSLALSRPVVLQFYYFASLSERKGKTAIGLHSPIVCDIGAVDVGLLALMADTRSLRSCAMGYMLRAVYGEQGNADESFPHDKYPKFDGLNINKNDKTDYDELIKRVNQR